MAKTVYESVTFLDPKEEVDEYAQAQALIFNLGKEHPEWKGLHWSVVMRISTEHTTEFRLTVTDPDAFDVKAFVQRASWVAGLVALVFILIGPKLLAGDV